MKKIIFLFLLTAPLLIHSQNDCSRFYPFSEGTYSEISMYDDKGKLAAVVEYTVTDVSSFGGADTANMASKIKDHKGKLIAESTYSVSCKNEVVSIDFESMMSPQMLEPFKEMDMEISGSSVDYPNNMTVGQTLPNASMEVKMNMAGMNMSIAMDMTNRKVVAKESITTPAGTFEAYLITYDSNTKTMGMNENSSTKQWIAEGVGMVKTESYDKKRKLTASGTLTKFRK